MGRISGDSTSEINQTLPFQCHQILASSEDAVTTNAPIPIPVTSVTVSVDVKLFALAATKTTAIVQHH